MNRGLLLGIVFVASLVGATWLHARSAGDGAGGQAGSIPAAPKRVLLLTHNVFGNESNVEAIEEMLVEWGKTTRSFNITSLNGYKQTASCPAARPCDPRTVDLSMVTRQYLSQFDGIVAATNGELPLTDDAKQALVDFVEKDGKGIVFLHQAAMTLYSWKAWGEMLGAYVGGANPTFDHTNEAKRPVVLKVEDRNHPTTRDFRESFGEPWTLHDEFYAFANTAGVMGPTKLPVLVPFSRTKVHVLISIDSEKTDLTGVQGWQKGGDYPQMWYQLIGKGRTFYTAIGHRPDLWREDPRMRRIIARAVRWIAGIEQIERVEK